MSTSATTFILATVALLAVVSIEWLTALAAAIGRITRSEAEDAFDADEASGRRELVTVARRPAALAGTEALRIICTTIYTLATTAAIAQFLHGWRLIAVFSGITILVFLLFYAAHPMRFGVRQHVGMIRASAFAIRFITWLGGLFVEEEPENRAAQEKRQEDQLAIMVERVSESEALDEGEREILESLFDMSETMVREVMVPRTDMITISADADLDSAISLFMRSGFSRIPVMGENLDDLRGVIYLKDAVRRLHRRSDTEGVTVADVMREPKLVAETQSIDSLMRQMQAEEVHMALVVDEYGGIAGAVTIEDLVEELVGEISDEHDRSEPEVEQLGEDAFRVPARLPIEDLGELFGLDIDDDDVETAAGLLTKALGRLPIRGSEARIDGLDLAADRFEGRRRRLATIIATRAPKEENHADE